MSKAWRTGIVILGILALVLIPVACTKDDSNNGNSTSSTQEPVQFQGKVAFYSDRDGNSEIYLMDGSSDNVRRLTYNSDMDAGPALSPNGDMIVFVSYRDYDKNIYIMKTDGSNQIKITNTSSVGKGWPSWSPDGSKILFSDDKYDELNIYSQTYMMNIDGSNMVKLTENSYTDFCPSWSPDGSKILFSSYRDGSFYSDGTFVLNESEIYVMDADGGNLVRLTYNNADDQGPSWSPDGRKIIFSSNLDGNYEIYVMNADGSNQIRLTNIHGDDFQPFWSPDGTQIAFVSNRDGNDEIYIMGADGSNQIRLTDNPASDRVTDWAP